MKVKNVQRSKFSSLSNWKEEAWKNQGFNVIRTRDLRDTGAMLYQMAINLHIGSEGNLLSSYSCSHSSFQLLKLKKITATIILHLPSIEYYDKTYFNVINVWDGFIVTRPKIKRHP